MITDSANPVSAGAFTSALAQFTFSSIGMMIGNKLAVMALPLPCVLVLTQFLGTLLLLAFCRSRLQPITKATAREWAPIAFLFTMMMFTSLKSFVYVNVSTVLIFRNVGAIVTTCVEYFVRNITVTSEIILSELVIVLGAVMYGGSSASFNFWGLFWILLNVTVQVFYGVFLKMQMDQHPQIKEMNKFTMSLHNNALALPLIVLMMLAGGELQQLDGVLADLTIMGTFWIAVTCVLGFMISTSGFALQQLVSATVFLIINNLTKFGNIALGMMFLQDRLVGVMDWVGCFAAFAGGFWFSHANMRANAIKSAAAAANVNGVAAAAGDNAPAAPSPATRNGAGDSTVIQIDASAAAKHRD